MFHHFWEVPSVLSFQRKCSTGEKNLGWSSVNVIQKGQNEHKSLLCPLRLPSAKHVAIKKHHYVPLLNHHSQDINLSSLR